MPQTFIEMYEVGFPTFKRIFDMDSKSIKNILKEICGDKVPNKGILEQGRVKKEMTDDIPEAIEIWHYDHVSITPFGISFYNEHNERTPLVEFNKFFTL